MHDEFAARQRAITLRLAGRPVNYIRQAPGRSDFWFHKWWRRYLEFGTDGLYDLTRANHAPQQIPPELERTILSVRRRLAGWRAARAGRELPEHADQPAGIPRQQGAPPHQRQERGEQAIETRPTVSYVGPEDPAVHRVVTHSPRQKVWVVSYER